MSKKTVRKATKRVRRAQRYRVPNETKDGMRALALLEALIHAIRMTEMQREYDSIDWESVKVGGTD